MYLLRFLLLGRSLVSHYLSPEANAAINASFSHVKATKALDERKLHLIIGNESCDLDSAVSAITLAYIYKVRNDQHDYVPVLNINSSDYELKTEVSYMFRKCGIEKDMLVFREDLPAELNRKVRVILVDHHISPWARYAVEIFDHRPIDQKSMAQQTLPEQCVRRIEPEIGSCATLVSEVYFAEPEPRSGTVTNMLHAAIVLDTINFSPTAKRFSQRDVVMVDALELAMHRTESGDNATVRHTLFDQLVTARADISELSLVEVLRKDMKMLTTNMFTVPMAGLPMLVKHFVAKTDADAAIMEFAGDYKLIVILGMYVTPTTGKLQRDLGIISPNGTADLVEHVKRSLLDLQDPDLELQRNETDINFMGGVFLHQLNVQATRKQILPAIKMSLLEWEAKAHDAEEPYFFKEKPKLSLS